MKKVTKMIVISTEQNEEGSIKWAHKFAEHYGLPFCVTFESSLPSALYMLMDIGSAVKDKRTIIYRTDQADLDEKEVMYNC